MSRKQPLPEGLKAPIGTLEQAKAWLDLLVTSNLDHHLEDDALTIGNIVDGNWVDLWTKADARIINARHRELYSFRSDAWGEYDCPIGYMMAKCDERDGTTDLK